jgi:hypothetical protein
MRELLEEVIGEDPGVELDDALTSAEFAELMGLRSRKAALRRIKPFIKARVLMPVQVERVNIVGVRSVVWGYGVNPHATWDEVFDVVGFVDVAGHTA